MSEDLERRVHTLEQEIADLKRRLSGARVIKQGAPPTRNYPPDDYYLEVPRAGDL